MVGDPTRHPIASHRIAPFFILCRWCCVCGLTEHPLRCVEGASDKEDDEAEAEDEDEDEDNAEDGKKEVLY